MEFKLFSKQRMMRVNHFDPVNASILALRACRGIKKPLRASAFASRRNPVRLLSERGYSECSLSIEFASNRNWSEVLVVVALRVWKETREGGHGCRPLTGHDGKDASGHALAGGRSMATEPSESWPVRIAPSEGLAA